ncbi:MAG: efflux RND transporter permease subunit [Desulfobacterales bacterium]
MSNNGEVPGGLIARIVKPFLHGKPTIVFLIVSFCLGIAAVMITPREEDPQIIVPLADVYVQAPGAGPEEIEKLVATPLEQLLWQIQGVEYVYSMSFNETAIVTVRFYVGEDREDSLVKLHNQITMHIDQVPDIVRGWVIKPVEIDDVPIVNLALYSDRYNDYQLRRIGEEVLWQLSKIENISRTYIIGGRSREIRVELLPEKMVGYHMSLGQVTQALKGSDAAVTAGHIDRFNSRFRIATDTFLHSVEDVKKLVVGVYKGRPVYLRDIAEVTDGPEEAEYYTRIGFSHRYRTDHRMQDEPLEYPSVTLALAKKRGSNAVDVSKNILEKLEELKKTIIPADVSVAVTRNYGYTAQEKVNNLLSSLGFAILTVVALLVFTLGRREAFVVAVAVPVSFSLALFTNYLLGYTINRVTLFALILSLGLVVDDPITNVDNIQRHIFMGRRNPFAATLYGVQEVLPPVIISTIAIIVSFVPLFFITGMMGPYMAPMAANVPLTVTYSTICALTIVPWMTYSLLKNRPIARKSSQEQSNTIFKLYSRLAGPFLASRKLRYLLLAAIVILLMFSAALVLFRMVPLKMLPFDNKNEFQLVIDMPEGTPLPVTDAVIREFEDYLRGVNEITYFVSYAGTHSPIDFNSMVRHYYLRRGAHQADIRIGLALKNRREQQSHAIALRVRKDLADIARRHNTTIQLVEVPPGPPVLATIVTELYGSPDVSYGRLVAAADHIKDIMEKEPNVVDVDDMAETRFYRYTVVVDKEKAALHGVSTFDVVSALKTAVSGETPATVHEPGERQPLHVKIILPRHSRSQMSALTQIPMTTAEGKWVPLAELVTIHRDIENQTIFHKNLEQVVYVIAEVAGRAPAEAILDMQKQLAKKPLPPGIRAVWAGEGEWKITLRVFRDMGIAFAAAMLGIYILMIMQTGSFFMPILIMMAIPLTLIGIMPGFWLLNLLKGEMVGGYRDLVFFTATSMIGMIALGGIVIRNSLVLIEFIQDAMKGGMDLTEAILQSGAIRMRPILLTAATTALGVWPITLDPIFSGLAWALIFGLLASTPFTLLVVPVTYYAVYGKK